MRLLNPNTHINKEKYIYSKNKCIHLNFSTKLLFDTRVVFNFTIIHIFESIQIILEFTAPSKFFSTLTMRKNKN